MTTDNGNPDGFKRVALFDGGEVLSDGARVVVLASPHRNDEDLPEDERHNCDAEGCGSSHVMWRGRLATPPAVPALTPADREAPGLTDALANTEDATVEAIAQWLEKDAHELAGEDDTVMTLRDVARDIRRGAWRLDPDPTPVTSQGEGGES